MKNIIVCFLTNKDSQEVSKISNRYFADFSKIGIDELNQLAIGENAPSVDYFVAFAYSSNQISDWINTLLSNCNDQFMVVLLLDQQIKLSDCESAFCDAFDMIINARQGYESAAAMLRPYIADRRLENDYTESERKYAALIKSVPGLVFRCKNDSDYTMLFLSRKVEKITGYTSRALINNRELTYSDIIVPGDREKVWLSIQNAIKRKRMFQLDYRIKTATGRMKWVRVYGCAYTLPDGKKILEGIILDIDRQKKHEKQHELIRNIILATYQSSELISLTKTIEKELKKFIQARNFSLAMFDWEKREFLIPKTDDGEEYNEKIPMSKTLDALVIRKNRPVFLRSAEILKLERQGEIHFKGVPPKVWLGVPLQIEGKASGIIVIQDFENEFLLDETDVELMIFVATQIAVSIAKNRDEEQSNILLQACDQSPVPAIVTDLDGRIVYANMVACEATGYSQQEMKGKVPNILEPYKNEPEHFSEVWKALKKNHRWTGEYQNLRKDGIRYIEYARIIAIKSSRGKTTHYLYLKEEITRRKQIEEELIRAKKHAEESNKLKTAFLANMSHEIRTPMNAIIGFTEMMQSDDFSLEEHREFHKLILENSRKLLNTIDNIIDIARIESGQMTIAHSRCSANKILYDNYYQYQKTKLKLDKSQIHFISRQYKKDENLFFYSDPVRINQVLDNMLENAFKYTSQGSVEFGYRLVVEDKKKYIDFYVKDSGSGISAQNQEMIFDRFAQIENDYMGSVGGNGLGLSISRSIARLMNGDIRVDSHEGKGSTFHFITPYIPFEASDFVRDEPKDVQAKSLMQWPDKLVLIAEDEDSNYKLLEIMLRKTQVKIYRAYNGKQAVDYVVGGNDVDLVLMDVRMPIMNGYEATRGIKEFNKNLPVIIQTAFAQSGDREDSFGAGCDAYLSKPISASSLYKIMKKFLS